VLAAAVGVLFMGSVSAAEGVRIGYVDMRKVMLESKAGTQKKAEIEKLIKQRQDKLAKEEQKLKDLEQVFEKDKLVLTDAQKKEKQKEFETKVQAFQKMASEAQREIGEKDNEFARKAVDDIKGIVRDLATEEKLTLVFEKNQQPVLYAEDGPDLTDKVLQRYDAKFGK